MTTQMKFYIENGPAACKSLPQDTLAVVFLFVPDSEQHLQN